MFKKTFLSLAVASAVTLAGCGNNDGGNANAGARNDIEGPLVDQVNEITGATQAIFNPALSELPVPNDILFATETAGDGTMSGSTANPITLALDFLDGASTVAPIDVKFTGALGTDAGNVDGNTFITGTSTPNPNQNVFLLKLTYPSGDALTQPEGELPTFALGVAVQASDATEIAKLTNTRAEIVSLDGINNVIRITPLEPLDPASKYLVVITEEVEDADGDPVSESVAFNELKGTGELASPSLVAVREAVNGWLSLAEGWFDASTNLSRSAFGLDELTADDVAIAYTFTTGGTTGVLSSVADPKVFFSSAAATTAKKEAVTLLNSDTFDLDGPVADVLTNADLSTDEKCINVGLLSAIPTLGLTDTYSSFSEVANKTDIYKLQAAAATVNNNIANQDAATIAALAGAGLTCGDGATHAQEATATVAALEGLGADFPTPEAQDVDFYTSVSNAALGLTNGATVYLGQISLDYFLKKPTDTNPSNLASTWEASTSVGDAIDTANSNEEGTTPPSDKITYRYPFPAEQTEVKAPILVHVPTACAGGGCPAIIYQHGIFGNRTHSLATANNVGNFVTVAIDMPLHGIAPLTKTDILDPSLALSVDVDVNNNFAEPAFKAVPTFEDLEERHFGWGNPTGASPSRMVYAATEDDASGASGENFINLSVLPNIRDNVRQAVVDLLNLSASMDNVSSALNTFDVSHLTHQMSSL
ncbi:hypothetical protein [Hahella ganghwensis]|uniref:hypothetical protein n=1 Tax=Hahella ganghwensis TaxID=286420 RepID=UPI0003A10F0F|nr:hypothetical protein [Hahella ganghwensis]